MGGYGAFKLALSRPEQYGYGASLSGALDLVGLRSQQEDTSNERYQYPRASPGKRRRYLLFRPKGRFISPCFPLPRSVMESW